MNDQTIIEGKAVAVHQPAAALAPVEQSETNAFLAMIERAARDPAVDLDKMERLILLRERMMAQQAKVAFDDALADVGPNRHFLKR